jgi:hypothetical protein
MEKPLTMYCDNSRVISHCKEPRNHKKDKHIERMYNLIQKFVKRWKILMD